MGKTPASIIRRGAHGILDWVRASNGVLDSASLEDTPLNLRFFRISRLKPYPFEVVSWLGLLTVVIFLRSHDLRIDWTTVDYLVLPFIPIMGKIFCLGIVMQMVLSRVTGQSLKTYLKTIFSARWIALTVRLLIVVLIFNYNYFWLKVCVPLVNFRLWDEAYWKLDIWLHFGYSPSVLLVELFTGTGLAGWLDSWYQLWHYTTLFAVAFFVSAASPRIRRPFILSCVLIWTVGAWLYVATPALGPIYVYQETWTELISEMPSARNSQVALWNNYQKMIAGRTGGLRQFNPTQGIAAMPSLHVGFHWLLMLWIRRQVRPLYLPAVVAVGLTFLGSIVTGWHYAVDGYVGIVLAQLAFWISLRTETSRRTETVQTKALDNNLPTSTS